MISKTPSTQLATSQVLSWFVFKSHFSPFFSSTMYNGTMMQYLQPQVSKMVLTHQNPCNTFPKTCLGWCSLTLNSILSIDVSAQKREREREREKEKGGCEKERERKGQRERECFQIPGSSPEFLIYNPNIFRSMYSQAEEHTLLVHILHECTHKHMYKSLLTLSCTYFEKFVRRTRLVIIHCTSCIISRNALAFMMNCRGNTGTSCLHFNAPSVRFLFHYLSAHQWTVFNFFFFSPFSKAPQRPLAFTTCIESKVALFLNAIVSGSHSKCC